MGDKIKTIFAGIICAAIGIFFAMDGADSLFLVGFIPVPGWLLAAVFVIGGLAVLVIGLTSKD